MRVGDRVREEREKERVGLCKSVRVNTCVSEGNTSQNPYENVYKSIGDCCSKIMEWWKMKLKHSP